MYYVYVLRSRTNKRKIYTGITGGLKRRLGEHNSADNKGYTAPFKPWELVCYVAFNDRTLAESFET